MLFENFLVYFILFILVFSFPTLRNKEKPSPLVKLFSLPALLGIGMVLLTVLKIYFVYKFLVLIAALLIGLLSYWQWGKRIRRWWR